MSADEYSKEPLRTYKDDITYQIVKANYKRNSFASSDHVIVSTGVDTLRNIEKSEKLLTSDLRRSQTALLTKLERLQKKQESLNIRDSPDLDKGLLQRRYSTPLVNFHRPISPIRKLRREHSTLSTAPVSRQKTGSSGSSGCDDDGDILDTSNLPSPRRDRCCRHSSGSTSPDMKEARRLSFVFQEETSKKALQKINALVDEHKRRATIAAGATHQFGLVPSVSDIARLREIAQRSISIVEEDTITYQNDDEPN
ncbi:hypothetical protein PoB_005417500 [Plakobranchus ocellatus]|uniref:Protein GRINL1A n=1 Tax=Plakobranchus ocellatus TaxID=259542 RepID=A0AAV4C4R6_9GAST|nr:hypothetical protein PoB_005417500 [Plakobranchus ocellatus]